MNQISKKVKTAANGYVKACWPQGCPPHQAIEVKLAFYAGMIETFSQINEIIDCSTDEDTEAELMEELFNVVKIRALRLNEERSK